jgi:hypothetical protein
VIFAIVRRLVRSLGFSLLCSLALGCAGASTAPCADPADVTCELDPGWQRRVAEPKAMSVVSVGKGSQGLPRAVTFGSAAAGKTALYLLFPELGLTEKNIERAYLRLEPELSGAFDTEPVDVEVWRVKRPWQSGAFDWSSQPALGPPHAQGKALGRKPLRIDVTELVREAALHPSRSHGLAVLGGAGDGNGVSFATGVGGQWLPRLEVYSK